MSGTRRSRAARELADASLSSCPHCGRTTKTIQGVCADCWGVKDPDVALDLRPATRTEPLLGFGSDLEDLLGIDPWLLVVGVLLLGGLVVALVYGVL